MPNLVLCRCDDRWPAFAVCEVCEARALHARLALSGGVRDGNVADLGEADRHELAVDQARDFLAALDAEGVRS